MSETHASAEAYAAEGDATPRIFSRDDAARGTVEAVLTLARLPRLAALILATVSLAACGSRPAVNDVLVVDTPVTADTGPDVARDDGVDAACASDACVATDPCMPNPCTETNRTTCVATSGAAECRCNVGTHTENGACVPDAECTPTTCSNHGTCSATDGGLSCACTRGYTGMFCESCDASMGFMSDGHGGCTMNPCEPNPCSTPGTTRCAVESGAAVCHCDAGFHDETGVCVADRTCTASSCAGHGACMDAGGIVHCACDPGWTGSACDACDVANGFHPDGAGGCTTDACLPNPCNEPHRSVCAIASGSTRCDCDSGYHLEGLACVIDETCSVTSCSAHGTCAVVGGRVQCTCTSGWTGATCSVCDSASGYHDDGAGSCTMDPCLPNPCTMLHRSVCTAMGATTTCGCDTGYHSDGAGNCTNDPCLPDPCAAMGMACRNNAGSAECYMPMCSDGNPCTIDRYAGGTCVHDPAPDGTSCTTTACLRSQTCSSGTCGGGMPISCDDGNPCTDDACDPTSGCRSTNDDTNVPDDSIACTRDRCATGVASHTADDTICDDGRWCTGVERCAPTASGADARGCIATSVPTPPATSTSPCQFYGTCDDATMSFPLVTRPAGTSCNDGIACTSGDVCQTGGACAGGVVASCAPGATCATTGTLGSTIDIPTATLTATVTMGGAPLPDTNASSYDDANFYLVAQDTGSQHFIGAVMYRYASGVYRLYAGSTLNARVMPGVYDLLYSRDFDHTYDTIGQPAASDVMINGQRILQRNVVIGPGSNRLSIDIPRATVTGSVTMGGAPLPATNASSYDDAYFYLVANDTGSRHYIGAVMYRYSGGVYTLYAGGTLNARVMPGTYDLVYSRDLDTTYRTVGQPAASDVMINGERILRRGVVITSGSNTLDVDIPVGTVHATVTMGGAALPASNASSYDDASFYLVAQDTGAQHYIGGVLYRYSGGVYTLYAGSTLDARVMPGTYDLVYSRDYDTTYRTVAQPASSDVMINGRRILQRNVVIAAGANSLAIDIPTATLDATVTMGGAALPASNASSYDDANFYLVATDTGAMHAIGAVMYRYSGGVYTLYAGSALHARVMPGTYDLLYSRAHDSTYDVVSQPAASDVMTNGYRILRRGIVINGGSNSLAIDIPTATLNATVTMGGAALPSRNASSYDDGYFYLVAQDTGTRHSIGAVMYRYSGGVYTLYAGSTLSARVMPGTYDVLYSRGWDSATNSVGQPAASDVMIDGQRILRRGVVITSGTNSLALDIPTGMLTRSVTMGGNALPPRNASSYDDANFYLVARDTSAEHAIGAVMYRYSGGVYTLYAGSTLSARVMPGTYDLLYVRDFDRSYDTIGQPASADVMINGRRLLGACLNVP